MDNSFVLPSFWARHFTVNGRREHQEVLTRRVQWVRGLTKQNIQDIMRHLHPSRRNFVEVDFGDFLSQVNGRLDVPQALKIFNLLNSRLPATAAQALRTGDWKWFIATCAVAHKDLRSAVLLVADPIEVKIPAPTVVEGAVARRAMPDMARLSRKSFSLPIVANWEKATALLGTGGLTLEETYNLECILDQYIPVWVESLGRVIQDGTKSDRAEAVESVFRQCDLVADYLGQVEDASGGDSVVRAKGELELQEGLLNSKFHRSGVLALEK